MALESFSCFSGNRFAKLSTTTKFMSWKYHQFNTAQEIIQAKAGFENTMIINNLLEYMALY